MLCARSDLEDEDRRKGVTPEKLNRLNEREVKVATAGGAAAVATATEGLEDPTSARLRREVERRDRCPEVYSVLESDDIFVAPSVYTTRTKSLQHSCLVEERCKLLNLTSPFPVTNKDSYLLIDYASSSLLWYFLCLAHSYFRGLRLV